jgi:hypothetical protein
VARTLTHTIHITLSVLGDETDIPARVVYNYTPGIPARGPTYSSGGEPPEPPEIEVLSAELQISEWKDGKTVRSWIDAPSWVLGAIIDSEEAHIALDEAAGDPELEAEARRESRDLDMPFSGSMEEKS